MPAKAGAAPPPLRIGDTTLQRGIELIGLGHPVCHNAVEITERRCLLRLAGPQAEPHAGAAAGRKRQPIVQRTLAALRVRIDGAHIAANKIVVDARP